MSNKIKLVIGVFVVVATLALVSGFGYGHKPAVSVARFAYLPVVNSLPLFVAIEKGYFDEAGVKIEATKMDAPNQIVDALLSDQIDFSVAGAAGITAIAESKKPNSLRVFELFGEDDSHVSDALLVSNRVRVSSIGDLKGKKIGVPPGIQWRTIAQNIFEQNGLDITKNLDLVELAIPLQAQALASGQVDALLTIEPVITIVEAQKIGSVLVTNPNLTYISNPFYAGVGNVSVKYIEKNKETFEKVMKVMEKATGEINANPNQYRQYLPKYTPLTPELSDKVNLPIYKMYKDISPKDIDSMQKFIDIFVKYKVMDQKIDASSLLIK